MKGLFDKSTIEVAKSLLGCTLIHETIQGITSGIIVETEAYLHDDPASHSFKGKTKRNSSMFGPPGRAYIYFTYGMYNCFNVVTEVEGKGEAVLIRAIQPLSGLDLMKKRRGIDDEKNLCNGPAKLVIAMGINSSLNNHDLTKKPLYIFPRKKCDKFEIVETKRIGISKGVDLPHRFYIKGNYFISRL